MVVYPDEVILRVSDIDRNRRLSRVWIGRSKKVTALRWLFIATVRFLRNNTVIFEAILTIGKYSF
jgi:hypothetical protein